MKISHLIVVNASWTPFARSALSFFYLDEDLSADKRASYLVGKRGTYLVGKRASYLVGRKRRDLLGSQWKKNISNWKKKHSISK